MKRAVMVVAMAFLIPVFACVLPAWAQHSVDERMWDQQRRIERGVENGALTHWETQTLEREQRQVDRERRKAWNDGYLSPQERRHLDRMQDKVDRDIYRKKHNQIQAPRQQWPGY